MRLIAKHSEVGYVVPQQRPSCRNCSFMTGEENGLNQVTYWSCRKHGFEVRTGGICKDHPRALQAPDVASPNRGRAGSGLSMASLAADMGGLRDQLRKVQRANVDLAVGLTPNFCQAGVVAQIQPSTLQTTLRRLVLAVVPTSSTSRNAQSGNRSPLRPTVPTRFPVKAGSRKLIPV